MPEVSVIIVNWNSQAYVRQCLASLFRHCRSHTLEVIVVDNASYDGCEQMLAQCFPSALYVQSDTNLGFARANNLGVRHSSGRNLLFLNPDTEFLEDSVAILLEQLRIIPDAGAAGCKLLNTDRSLQDSCVQSLPTVFNQVLGCEVLRRIFPNWGIWGIGPVALHSDRPIGVEFISGACILMKREIFELIGGFTEHYFMYAEDADICFKTRSAGFAVLYVPETSLLHHGGGSSQKSVSNFSNVMMKESLYLYFRHQSGLSAAILYRFAMGCSAMARLFLLAFALTLASRTKTTTIKMALRKWYAILRWSAGMEQWVRNYCNR